MALQKDDPSSEVHVFLLADALSAALSGQGAPQGYYNIERMLKAVIAKGGMVRLCGTCCEARRLKDAALVAGLEVSTMAPLAAWTIGSEKVLEF
jgi:uncharacterized protein involved in oxidation of intracellular sulfur